MSKTQLEIPGTERPKIKAIETAAAAYVDIRDKRMKMTVQEVAAKAKLIAVMDQNLDQLSRDGEENFIYRYGDEVVVLTDKMTVKVKSASEPEGDGE